MQASNNSFSFVSPSDDLRFVEADLLTVDQLRGYAAKGPVVAVVGLVVGYGSNFLNLHSIENRLILNNGSHRAYTLRDSGVTHVPCIVQHVSRRDELEVVGPADVQQHPERYLTADRPPLLKDYFDPLLLKVVPVVRKNRVVNVSFGVQTADLPSE